MVNIGSVVFTVVSIEWDHWMWSLFLGMGCLIWQLVKNIYFNKTNIMKLKVKIEKLIYYISREKVITSIPTAYCEKLFEKVFCSCCKSKAVEADNQIELSNHTNKTSTSTIHMNNSNANLDRIDHVENGRSPAWKKLFLFIFYIFTFEIFFYVNKLPFNLLFLII